MVKDDARRLKFILKNFYTWKETALTFLEACDIQIEDNSASVNLERWNPDVLIEALRNSPDIVENAARRRNQYEQIWGMMKEPSEFTQVLILFGGIASQLCDETAVQRYADWLVRNPYSRFYICYESGPSAMARAKKLNPKTLERSNGLPIDAIDRMIVKEKKVLDMMDLFIKILGDKFEIVSHRIHFIPLKEPLTTYIMISDNKIYITPLMETRSSETLSFALAHKPKQFRLDVYNFIKYHLENLEDHKISIELIKELEKKIKDEMIEDE